MTKFYGILTKFILSMAFVALLFTPINAQDQAVGDGELTAAAVALLYKSLGEHIQKNIAGSGREKGEIDKLLKAITGVSKLDIEKYGICGGKNSELRKILGNKVCGSIE